MDIDLRKMFPEALRRVEVLESLQRAWPSIVGRDVGKYSRPYCLGIMELCVVSDNNTATQKLLSMKGNVIRAMTKRFGYKPIEGFSLRITKTIPPERKPVRRAVSKAVKVVVSEEEVRQCMRGAPDTLPEDINYAISHLEVFLAKRFGSKKHPRK